MAVEEERIRKLNGAPERGDRKYVLYWAQMNRRVDSNHALLYAVERANAMNLPVLAHEGITCTYDSANDRLHTFMLQGVPETARRLEKAGIGYACYVPAKRSPRAAVIEELARNAAAVVADDYPAFVARAYNGTIPEKLDVAYYVVDSSCVVPMNCIETRQYGAYTIRPKITKLLPRFLSPADKLRVKRRFDGPIPSFHVTVTEDEIDKLVAKCEIDHGVPPSVSFAGGRKQAEKRLRHFLEHDLYRYEKARNEPSEHATSNLSPYLHFGQISALEIALAVQDFAREHKLIPDAYLEELIVRRELAFNYCRFVTDPASLDNLPEWAQKNMRKHARDKRDPVYTAGQLERAETYDELWNATQREMLLRGKIHGYYRMYWGKKIIEWSPNYAEAARIMIGIHDRYALDGRDPNTYTNVLWCFGLHDRPWPERPVFGTMRYMSLDGMKRKTDTAAYIREIAGLTGSGQDREPQLSLWS